MFNFVHHVQYVVRDRDEIVAYLERNFGMKPERLEDREGHGKDAIYRVGETEIQIGEPAPGTSHAEFLEKNGPGVHHVAWGVDDVPILAQDLMAKGNTLRGESGFTQSGGGYNVINIDTRESLGADHFIQLVEEPK